MYGHPWIDQGCRGNYVVNGYSERGYGYSVCMAIHGWTTDGSMDTVTGGMGTVCVWPSMDGPGMGPWIL